MDANSFLMNWAHLAQFQPEINAAYAVSDGYCVGIGIWKNNKFTQVHLDDEDTFDLGPVNKNQFVWWAHVCVERFGVNKLDPDEFKMLQAEDRLISKMRIIEQFGPDMLKDEP